MRLGRTSEVLHGGGVRPEKVKALGAGPAIAADAVALVRLGGGGRRAGRLARREPAAEHGAGAEGEAPAAVIGRRPFGPCNAEITLCDLFVCLNLYVCVTLSSVSLCATPVCTMKPSLSCPLLVRSTL